MARAKPAGAIGAPLEEKIVSSLTGLGASEAFPWIHIHGWNCVVPAGL
jgi:hypothetical protein